MGIREGQMHKPVCTGLASRLSNDIASCVVRACVVNMCVCVMYVVQLCGVCVLCMHVVHMCDVSLCMVSV